MLLVEPIPEFDRLTAVLEKKNHEVNQHRAEQNAFGPDFNFEPEISHALASEFLLQQVHHAFHRRGKIFYQSAIEYYHNCGREAQKRSVRQLAAAAENEFVHRE